MRTPTRRTVLAVAAATGVLFILLLALDRADEDSTLGTVADWCWVVFMVSVVVLVAVSVLALIGKLRTQRTQRA
jgi:hypothetical protein